MTLQNLSGTVPFNIFIDDLGEGFEDMLIKHVDDIHVRGSVNIPENQNRIRRTLNNWRDRYSKNRISSSCFMSKHNGFHIEWEGCWF